MACFHPREILVDSPKGRYTYLWTMTPEGYAKKVKKVGVALKYCVLVPCGKCLACLAQQQSQWSFRIEQEVLYGDHPFALFVTFTYDNEHLPEDLSVSKTEVQKYLHDLRQNLHRRYFDGADKETVPSVRYYFCAEYGSKRGRPHYHAILMFNKSVDWRIIQSSWSKGIVDIREFNSARAGYVAKYSVKQLDLDYEGRTRPFHLQSQGLGKTFINGKTLDSLKYNLYYRNLSGRKVKLPRYYIDKLGVTRKYTKVLHKDGSVTRKSESIHSYAYDVTVATSQMRFEASYCNAIARSGLSQREYDLRLISEHETLEHNLIQRNKQSIYYVKSRIGL